MSVDRNFGRTLSGQTDLSLDNIRLPNNVNTIKIDGNSGLPNQVLAKNGTTNRLEWDFVESTTIPDGSITGNKLAPNININTTGNITGAIITATDKFVQSGTNENLFNGQLRTPAITTLNSGDGVTTLNGGNVELFSDGGTTKKIELDGSTGTITCEDLNINNHTGTIEFNEIKTDKLILPITGTANCEILSSGNIITNGTITGGSISGTSLTSGGLISGGSITTAGNITATGTSGFVGVGTDADTYKIILDKNGEITCDDLNVNNHTGEITFNDLVCNDLESKTFEILNPDSSGFTFQLTNNTMSFAGAYTINGASANATLKSLILSGGNAGGVDTFVVAGSTDTTSDTSGNLGSITAGTGNITATTGNIIATAGNVIAGGELGITGLSTFNGGADFLGNGTINIKNSANELVVRFSPIGKTINLDGEYISIKVGSGTPPTDNTYTDWALDLNGTGNTGHAHISGNIICDGIIYGSVEGSITEELVDCQRLTVRTDPSGSTSGLTQILIKTNNSDIGLDMVNGADIKMNNGNIMDGDTVTASNGVINLSDPIIRLKNGSTERLTLADNFIKLNDSSGNLGIYLDGDNSRIECGTFVDTSVIIEKDLGISVGLSNSMKTKLSCAGNLEYLSSDGEIIGFSLGSSSTVLSNTTLATKLRLDNTNFKNALQEISISKPSQRLQRTFTATSTDWIDINDALVCKIITDDLTATNFIVTWTYYAVKDDGMRMWAKLFDPDEASPEDADQPDFLNNTKQVLFDGGADKTGQHTATFTMRNVTANTNRKISVCIWNIVNSKSFINFYIGPTTFSGDPPTGGSASSYAYGGMTLQQQKLFDGSSSNSSPTGWSAPSADLLYVRNNPINSPYFYHKTYDPSSTDFDSLSTSYQALLYANVSGLIVAETESIVVELITYNYTSSSNKWFYLRLVDTGGSEFSVGINNGGNGTGTRNTTRNVHYADETDKQPVMVTWKLEGLTIGNTYNLAPQVKTSGTFNYAVAGGYYLPTILRAYKLENEEEVGS